MDNLILEDLFQKMSPSVYLWKDDVKELHALLQPRVVVVRRPVVLWQGRQEDDGLDVVEAVNPVATFRPLAANVDDSQLDSFLPIRNPENVFDDSGSRDPEVDDVVLRRHVVVAADAIERRQKVNGRIHQIVFISIKK